MTALYIFLTPILLVSGCIFVGIVFSLWDYTATHLQLIKNPVKYDKPDD